ncbi:hypothetical protein ACWKX9_25035 [Enterobacter asburiae]
MKSELSFVSGCEHERHRRRGQRAVRLELAGLFDLAAQAWARVAKQAPRAGWRAYAEARVVHCRRQAQALHIGRKRG